MDKSQKQNIEYKTHTVYVWYEHRHTQAKISFFQIEHLHMTITKSVLKYRIFLKMTEVFVENHMLSCSH